MFFKTRWLEMRRGDALPGIEPTVRVRKTTSEPVIRGRSRMVRHVVERPRAMGGHPRLPAAPSSVMDGPLPSASPTDAAVLPMALVDVGWRSSSLRFNRMMEYGFWLVSRHGEDARVPSSPGGSSCPSTFPPPSP